LIDTGQLQRQWEGNPDERGELGAAVCVWSDAGEAVSLVRGRVSREPQAANWAADTLVPVWSTTKGPAAATLLWALDKAHLTLDTPVQHVWPELSATVTFGQLLSHQAGLAALDVDVSVFGHSVAAVALERQTPNWTPGAGHGYHPRTFGVLLDECVRRLCGAPLGQVWLKEIARPLGLDVWIGLPKPEWPRVATVYPGKLAPRPDEAAFHRSLAHPSSLTGRAFRSLHGLNGISEMNAPSAWELGFPAFGGVATARGLAKFYHLLATGGGGHFSARVRAWMEVTVVDGDDLVLLMPTGFAAGFQKDPLGSRARKLRQHYGPSLRAFGHPGAGGSLAFGDPEHRIGFAYVMNLIAPGVMPGEPALSLVQAVYSNPAKPERNG
jgi:CubicO group peptidase (beta-lactamase class C family)